MFSSWFFELFYSLLILQVKHLYCYKIQSCVHPVILSCCRGSWWSKNGRSNKCDVFWEQIQSNSKCLYVWASSKGHIEYLCKMCQVKNKTKPDHANQYILFPRFSAMCCAYGPGDDLSCATEKIITELLATLWPLAFGLCNLCLCLICRINNESKNIVSLRPYFTAWNYFKPFCIWISLVTWASVVFQGMNQGI